MGNIAFKKAEKSAARIRMALVGPSGSGKTYSALRIAKGIGGRTVMIDTERGSGSLYSDRFEYDYAEMSPPYTSERYVEYLHAAETAGYDIIIFDSLTHAWAGEGGLLEQADAIKRSGKYKNEFMVWADITPKQNRLLESLLGSKAHLIITMRTKTAYEMIEKNGKKVPVKIGLAPIQRDGVEYEFTIVADLAIDGHVATFSKDRTGLFDGTIKLPDEEMGKILAGWLTKPHLKQAEAKINPQAVFKAIFDNAANHKFINEQSGNADTPIPRHSLDIYLVQWIPSKDMAAAAARAQDNLPAFLQKFAEYIANETKPAPAEDLLSS